MSKKDYEDFEIRGFEHDKLYVKHAQPSNDKKDDEKKPGEKLNPNEKKNK
ncbi:MAG: hypothetical protein ACLR2K_01820 [Paraclostridium sordellii]